MKRKILFICLVLISGFARADMPEKLKNYFCIINKAELWVIDSNYAQAIVEYENAEMQLGSLYIKDRYNYAVTCALQNQYKKCTEQIKYIIGKGGKINAFQKNKAFNGYFQSKEGKQLCDCVSTINPTYNLDYRRKLDSLVYLDQLFRVMPGGYTLYGDTIRSIDSLNVITFNNLILKYGFPTEDLIGVDTVKFNRPIYDILILHNRTGAKYRTFDFTRLMKTALDSGWLELHTAADYVEMSNGISIWGIEELRPLRCVYDSINMAACYGDQAIKPDYSHFPIGFSAMSSDVENKYNSKRLAYCLESVNDARRKALFQLSDKRFDFTYSKLDVFVFPKKSEYDRMMNTLIFITK
ncbi:hypothetical protein BH11BAC2_BH11BAC2_25040 [soil metagenome]